MSCHSRCVRCSHITDHDLAPNIPGNLGILQTNIRQIEREIPRLIAPIDDRHHRPVARQWSTPYLIAFIRPPPLQTRTYSQRILVEANDILLLQHLQRRLADTRVIILQRRSNSQWAFENSPQREVRLLLRQRKHPVAHIQHIQICPLTGSSEIRVGDGLVQRAEDTSPRGDDVVADAPGVPERRGPKSGKVDTPFADLEEDWSADTGEGGRHDFVAGTRRCAGFVVDIRVVGRGVRITVVIYTISGASSLMGRQTYT